jgi:uncharacterized protein (DUF924 family)
MTDTTPAETGETRSRALVDFWFDFDESDADAAGARIKQWFASSAGQDRELAERFGDLAAAAAAGELDGLAASPRGRLALILLLDQLPRSLHRGTAGAFAQDEKALELCVDGMRLGHLDRLSPLECAFFCMPLQHAESLDTQKLSVATFSALAAGDAPAGAAAALRNFADYAVIHRDIVERFGRFPHRNGALNRESTPAEIEFLESGGPSFGQ